MENELCLERRLKLEQKLVSMSGDCGGMLKIYGACLNEAMPYKSLLVSVEDTSDFVIGEMLEKYGIETERAREYCLMMQLSGGRNIRLKRNDRPLQMLLWILEEDQRRQARFEIVKKPMRVKKRSSNGNQQSKSLIQQNNQTFIQLDHSLSKTNHVKRVNTIATDKPTNQQQNNISKSTRPLTPPLLAASQANPLPSYEESLYLIRPQQPPTPAHSQQVATSYQISPMDQYLARHLPVQLTYFKSKQTTILDTVICQIKPLHYPVCEFRLVTAYILHLMSVDIIRIARTSLHQHNSIDSLDQFISQVATRIRRVVLHHKSQVAIQVYWLANTSEFLHLLSTNSLLHPSPRQWYYEVLAELCQTTFNNIHRLFSLDVLDCIPVLYAPDPPHSTPDQDLSIDLKPLPHKPSPPNCMSHLIRTLSSCLALLHQHHLNSALAIQLIARLLHFIDSNIVRYCLSTNPQAKYISNWQMLDRIRRIRNWCQHNDLISAAEKYLQPSTDACTLLQMLERSDFHQSNNQLELLYNACIDLHNLNSLQIRRLLEQSNYRQLIPQIWIDFVASGVVQVADQMILESNGTIQLEPSEQLDLPLLIPEDSYHVEQLRKGTPRGLLKYLTSNLLPKEWCFCQSVDFDACDLTDENNDEISQKSNSSAYSYDWLCIQQSDCNSQDQENLSQLSFGDDYQISIADSKSESVIVNYQRNNSTTADADTNAASNTNNLLVNNSTYQRHQLKFSDFKGNFIGPSDSFNSNRSTLESGFETDRVTNAGYENEDDCSLSDNCVHPNNTSPVLTNGTNLFSVKSIHSAVQNEMENIAQSIAQQYSLVEQHLHQDYRIKLNEQLDQWNQTKNLEMQQLKTYEDKTYESRSAAFQKYRSQKDTERKIEQERMTQIVNLELASHLNQQNSVNRSHSASYRYESSHCAIPRGRTMNSLHSCTSPHSRHFTNANSLDRALNESPRPRSHSQGSNSSRSLSKDRYYWLMTQDLEKLNFQEKLDIFEFGIQRQ